MATETSGSITNESMESSRHSNFTRQRQNDRKATEVYIDRRIRAIQKTDTVTLGDRWPLLQKLREEKITMREISGHGSTRSLFPDKHDQQLEDNKLRDLYSVFLKGNRPCAQKAEEHTQDRDDDERILSSVKQEPSDDPNSEDKESEDESDQESRKLLKASTKVSEPSTYGACSRGLAICLSLAEPDEVKASSKDLKDEKASTTASHTTAYRDRAAKRRWKWAGNDLIVWPPF